MTDRAQPRVSVVMLAWGDEPVLIEAIDAVLGSTGVDVDVVLVDNGCTTDAVHRARERARVTIIEPGENTGFARGCNIGASRSSGEIVAFVNGDAVVDPGALAALARTLQDDSVGLASGSLRLYDDPTVMNSAGNPVHYTGLSWAGALGEPASLHDRVMEIASATGAATAIRADRFAELGGFCEPMFAYCEDTDLSLRCWQRGWRVVYVPDAVVLHRYEFSRNDRKLYLLERNRIFMLMTLYQRRTLMLLAPALLGLELAMLAVALKQGWWRQKLSGWSWLWRHRDVVRARRARVQAERRRTDAELAPLLTGDFAPGESTGLAAPGLMRAGSRCYWAWVRRLMCG
jgi:GT2 family glycosyltransferase